MSQDGLIRDQHPNFGKELRTLLGSKKKADRELAGIIVSEVDDLRNRKEKGEPHRLEKQLAGENLSDIRYL